MAAHTEVRTGLLIKVLAILTIVVYFAKRLYRANQLRSLFGGGTTYLISWLVTVSSGSMGVPSARLRMPEVIRRSPALKPEIT